MTKVIMVSGATGFLGSHIIDVLIKHDCKVIALKRTHSDFWRSETFKDQVTWLDTDQESWPEKTPEKIDIIIHAAWSGVGVSDRDDWTTQMANLPFMMQLLELANKKGVTQFIGLGSQAEYGIFSGKVSEDYPATPVTAYGTAKLLCSQLLSSYATIHQFNWYWLRLFSFFGEKESDNWFIPSVIKKLQHDEKMDFTPGEQKYAYMYVTDLANAILSLIERGLTPASGIYNLSSNKALTLKEIVLKISGMLKSQTQLNFGAMPYRPNQAMHIEGDISKFEENVAPVVHSDFDQKLLATISYFKAFER